MGDYAYVRGWSLRKGSAYVIRLLGSPSSLCLRMLYSCKRSGGLGLIWAAAEEVAVVDSVGMGLSSRR